MLSAAKQFAHWIVASPRKTSSDTGTDVVSGTEDERFTRQFLDLSAESSSAHRRGFDQSGTDLRVRECDRQWKGDMEYPSLILAYLLRNNRLSPATPHHSGVN